MMNLVSKTMFIMTTHLDNHWDGVKKSVYNEKWIKFDPSILEIGTEMVTLFIKVSKVNYSIEKVWIGKSKIIAIHDDKYKFEINIEKEISIEEFYKEFSSIADNVTLPGWYLVSSQWYLK